MKTLTFIILLIAIKMNARDIDLKTTITEVTVFQNGAQVKRTGSVMIPAGESEIIISDATSLLKKESIQVKGEGDFTILSVNFQSKYNDVDNEKSKWVDLEVKQKSLMKQMEDLSVKIQILNSEEVSIMNLTEISTTTKGVTVEQIVKAQELVRIKLAEIKNEKLKASRQILDLYKEHQTVSQHLVALKTIKQSVKYEIIVKVSSKNEVKGDFTISYIVPNAHWYPTYDIRVKNVSEPMIIEYKANVSQESGEDWNAIKLKLSTGDPSQSSEKPEIEPWWLYLNQNYIQPGRQDNFYRYTDARFIYIDGIIIDNESGEPVPWSSVMVFGSSVGTTADSEGRFSMVLPDYATQIYVYSIGYYTQAVNISEKNLTIKLQKEDIPLNEVVNTDYEKELMTLQSPIFNTDYDGVLSTVDLSVNDELYLSVNDADAAYSYAWASNGTTNADISSEMYSSSRLSKQEILKIDAGAVVATKTLNIVSTEYSIEEKYTILSDPKNIAVSIQTIKTDAKYQFYCAPRLDKDVFLTARLVDWEQYNLLEGQANVFFEETFVGNTLFDTRYLVDTLEISLGRDKGIKVERNKSMDYNKSQFIGNDIIVYRDWDITVRNAKQQPIDIIIEDQFPMSVDGKIQITQEEKSEGLLNEATGIVTWPFRLDPSATKKMQLKYKVKFPRENTVGLD